MKARPATPIPLQTAPTVKTGLASLVALGAAQAAHAQIVMSTTLPDANGGRPPLTHGFVDWDVDNDGTADFRFRNYDTYYAQFTELNGGRIFGLVGSLADPFQKLNFGQTIGPSVPGYGFAANAQYGSITGSGLHVVEGAQRGGWASGTTGNAIGLGTTGYLGFRFTTNGGSDTHYGWANVTIDGLDDGGYGYIFNEAYYNTTPGASITAGAVPEPAAAATGLGFLALGAAGLRRQRWLQRNRG